MRYSGVTADFIQRKYPAGSWATLQTTAHPKVIAQIKAWGRSVTFVPVHAEQAWLDISDGAEISEAPCDSKIVNYRGYVYFCIRTEEQTTMRGITERAVRVVSARDIVSAPLAYEWGTPSAGMMEEVLEPKYPTLWDAIKNLRKGKLCDMAISESVWLSLPIRAGVTALTLWSGKTAIAEIDDGTKVVRVVQPDMDVEVRDLFRRQGMREWTIR